MPSDGATRDAPSTSTAMIHVFRVSQNASRMRRCIDDGGLCYVVAESLLIVCLSSGSTIVDKD